jgi:hypothetical protein
MPMTIQVPIKKAATDFALGFLYNEVTGSLEALPVVTETDTTVTVMTRHFATSSLTLGKRFAKGAVDNSSVGNIIISTIATNILTGQNILNTNFTPGVDDWEFINYGSFIAPGGHCAGQSITAMWYYYEKKQQLGNLFHSLDKLDNPVSPSFMWMDNRLGYRFASTIQDDFNWDLWIEQVNITSFFSSLTWDTFIGAMLVTGQPQFVIIKNSANNDGHAMIVYKIDVTQGKLYIADPNFPNNYDQNGNQSVRTINYVNGRFQPYPSALNAASSQVLFDQIAFFGKTSNIDWSQITNRWTEVQNKTIGNDRFPQSNLYYTLGNNQINISDSLTISADTLNVSVHLLGHWTAGSLTGYDENGNLFSSPPSKTVLQPGTHYYGYYTAATPVTNPATQGLKFVDFKWIKITKQSSYSLAWIFLRPVDATLSFISLSDSSNISSTIGWTNKGTFSSDYQKLIWVGNNFTVNYSYADTLNSELNLITTIVGSISGTLDPVKNKIDSLSCTVTATTAGAGTTQSILLTNVPVTISTNSIDSNIPDGGAQSYVKSFDLHTFGINVDGQPYTFTLQSVNWSNVSLGVSLSK